MKLSVLASLLLTALPALSTPVVEERSNLNAHLNHLETRATRSSQGWYAYGCYFDCYDGMNRRLPILAYVDDNNNPDMCVQWCKDHGHNYAGLQWTKECYCGDSLAGEPAPPGECTHQCADGKNKCGGPCRNNIWSAFQKPGH